MNLADNSFKPEQYTYNDYKLWEGNWELISGYPIARSPSPKRAHQWFTTNFARITGNALAKQKENCNCEVYVELDWVVNENTVVRPDYMIVCGNFTEDYLHFPPTLILEVSSHSTRIRDRNTKFNLYEILGVKYYILADEDKTTIEIYELNDNKYRDVALGTFNLSGHCNIHIALDDLWDHFSAA